MSSLRQPWLRPFNRLALLRSTLSFLSVFPPLPHQHCSLQIHEWRHPSSLSPSLPLCACVPPPTKPHLVQIRIALFTWNSGTSICGAVALSCKLDSSTIIFFQSVPPLAPEKNHFGNCSFIFRAGVFILWLGQWSHASSHVGIIRLQDEPIHISFHLGITLLFRSRLSMKEIFKQINKYLNK